MSIELAIAAAVAALAVGGLLGWWLTRSRLGVQVLLLEERALARESRIRELGDELLKATEKFDHQLAARAAEANVAQLQLRDFESRLAASETQLREERKSWESKLALLDEARVKLSDAFKVLSTEVLQTSNASFLELAQQTLSKYQTQAEGALQQREQAVQALVAPIAKSLDKVEAQIQLVEKTRAQAYGSLTEHLGQVMIAHNHLRTETGNLVKALRAPQARGRWGEIQLQRVCEMAGMLEHCDFEQQASVGTPDGRLRPDLIIHLPGGRRIVVDAKAPLAAYLEAIEAGDDAVRAQKLREHAQQVRAHLAKLSTKQYWTQFQPTPEFVVLFLPGESFFSAALQEDPALIEEGVNQKVIVATPTTLVALLKAVSFGWNQEKINQENQKIAALGNELYERIRTFATHLLKAGSGLNTAVDCYNKALSSLETRVVVSARRFKELGATTAEDLPELNLVEAFARTPELVEAIEPASRAAPRPEPVTAQAMLPLAENVAPAVSAPAAHVAPPVQAAPPTVAAPAPAVLPTALAAAAASAAPAISNPDPMPAAASAAAAAAAPAGEMAQAPRGAPQSVPSLASRLEARADDARAEDGISRSRRRNPMDRLLAAMGRTSAPRPQPAAPAAGTERGAPADPRRAPTTPMSMPPMAAALVVVDEPPAPGVDPFPELDELLDAPAPAAAPSMEEIMAMVGDDPDEPVRPT